MVNRDNLIEILDKMWATKTDECLAIFTTELVNKGLLTTYKLQTLTTGNKLDTADDISLLLLYDALANNFSGMKPTTYYFTEEEIRIAKSTFESDMQSKLPISFKILATLRENSYLICQSIQEIANLKEGGLIRWVEGMQRESVTTKVGDKFVSHIAYDDTRARKIGAKISSGEFFPNALRWHIVTTFCEYHITNEEFVLTKGSICEIDGQHRDKGSEYALADNPNINLQMPIILTVGTPRTAQLIINQDEERAPIDKELVKSFAKSVGNTVADKINQSRDADNPLRFSSTIDNVKSGYGAFLLSDLGEAIDKVYFSGMSYVPTSVMNETANQINDFLDLLLTYQTIYSDITDYRNSVAKKWTAESKSIMVYVALSKWYYDNGVTKAKLDDVIKSIKFRKNDIAKFNIEYITKVLRGCGYDV